MATMLSIQPHGAESTAVISRIRRAPALILPIGEGRLHAKLYHRLRDLIEGGNWSPGTRLPSSRVLAEDLGVSRNTASIALEHLVAEGWAEARSRSGIFVSRRLPRAAAPSAHLTCADAPVPSPNLSEVPVDLFPLRHWRSIQAKLWAAHGHDLLEAPAPEGEAGLRQSLARLVCTARGFEADPDTIIIAAGAGAAIGAITAAVAGEGAMARTADPECPSIIEGLAVHAITPRPLEGDTRCAIVSAALHVPTGASLSAPARRALLQWAGTGERWIIERDCSGWAACASGHPIPPLAADPAAARVIYVRGFADILFPGLPLCFVVAPQEIAGTIRAALARHAACPSRADQLAFKSFIDEGYLAAHLRRLKRALPERRETLVRLLLRYAGAHVRVGPARMPRHLILESKTDTAERIAVALRWAGLPVQMLPRSRSAQPLILVGFGGLTDDAARQVEARLRQLPGAF